MKFLFQKNYLGILRFCSFLFDYSVNNTVRCFIFYKAESIFNTALKKNIKDRSTCLTQSAT